MLVALGSLTSGAGVSTTALALATLWPGQSDEVATAVLDCDPAGAGLADRHGLHRRRGLQSLADDCRRIRFPACLYGLDEEDADIAATELLFGNSQFLPGDVAVLAGGRGPAGARATLEALFTDPSGALLRRLVAAPDLVLVADCGRLEHSSPALPMMAAADVVLLLVPSTRPELTSARSWAGGARTGDAVTAGRPAVFSAVAPPPVGLILTDLGTVSSTGTPGETPVLLGSSVYGQLPDDAVGAARLHETLATPGRLHRVTRDLARLPLIRAVHVLAYRLDAALFDHARRGGSRLVES